MTLPEEVREYLHLEGGDAVEFVIADEQVVLRSVGGRAVAPTTSEIAEPSFLRLEGMLAAIDQRPLSPREMDEAIAEHVRRDDERIRRRRKSSPERR